jgi:AcrR family transcriptional regulator
VPTEQPTEQPTDQPPAPPGRPGRPRDARRDEEILTAALRLLEHSSYADLSVAAIARSAGVGKPTLYLRWSSKASVVADAVVRVLSPDPFPDLGDVRSDVVAGLGVMIRTLNTTAAGRVLPALVADLHGDPELSAAFHERYFAPRRGSLRAALQRGVERGEIAPGTDLDLVVDALVGPVYYRLLARSGPVDTSPEALVDLVLRACRP